MKNFALSVFFILLFQNLLSQEKSVIKTADGFEIKLNFDPVEYLRYNEGDLNKYDFIFNEDESKPGLPKLPVKVYFIAIPPESKIQVDLLNKSYTEISDVLIEKNRKPRLVDDSLIVYEKFESDDLIFNNFSEYYPKDEIEVIDYIWVRDYYCAIVKINTHTYFFNSKVLRILDSATLKIKLEVTKNFTRNFSPDPYFDELLSKVILNFNEAKEYKSFNPFLTLNDSTDNWIDYTKEYVKLAIPVDNIYRITYNDLVSYGVNPSLINPKTFKLYRLGRELPLFVKGEDDLQFNQDDYIEFWAEKNYSYQDYRRIVNWTQDYINFMNRYSDTSIVWLTWDGDYGKRISFDEAPTIQTQDTIKSHLVKYHFERDVRLWYYDAVDPRVQLPQWQENKVFTWLVIGNGGSQSIAFQARDFMPQTPVKVVARFISYATSGVTNAHKNGLSLNSSTPTDTIIYNFRQTVNFERTYSSSQLVNGNNVVRIFGLPSQVSFHQSFVDWVDVEYFRKNIISNDTLLIIIPDTVQKDLSIITIENVAFPDSELVIYKLGSEGRKFINYTSIGNSTRTIYLIDSVRGGDRYYFTRVNRISSPIFKQKKQFINLRNSSRGADYILLTTKLLSNSSAQYKNFISQTYNLRTELVFIEDIFDEFSYGQVEAEAVKRFLMAAYRNWQLPKPSYLTLIGDANYDYKDVVTPAPTPRKKNLVISYGNPVSDVWYVMWDSVNVYFPQMYVGRVPALNDEQVLSYLLKHQKYITRKYDDFNKTFLFFSGGDGNNPYQIEQIRLTNEFLYQNFVLVNPVYGKGTHFYKTVNPPTNFGPYTPEQVKRAIDEGGLYISYIGHSGTRVWDNSITEVEHLQNKYSDRFPLVTDFGCSTGKFAEPDVDAFGELFIVQSPNGQALVYLGNSSWGYLSTSLRFPKYFYEQLTFDSLKGIGRAHLMSKIRQINETGTGDVNKVFTYCNLLFGDPIIGLRLPEKPNLYIDNSKIKLLTQNPNDQTDSVEFLVQVSNYGLFKADSILIRIQDYFSDSLTFEKNFIVLTPKFVDTLFLKIPVQIVGEHKLKIALDPTNVLNEIYEDDNETEFNYVINSTSISVLENHKFYNSGKDTLYFLNPFIKKSNSPERILVQISETPNFSSYREIVQSFDTLFTKVYLHNLLPNKRYYYRVKIDSPQDAFSEIYSFKSDYSGSGILIDEPNIFENDISYNNTKYDTVNRNWTLDQREIELKIQSAGGHDGAFGSIMYNSYEQLPTTYYWGLATALIDSITLKPYSIRYFYVPDPGVMDSLTNYINNLPAGTWIAMTISADAQQNILGGRGSRSRNAIKTLGSLYIDSVQYREGWCILGKKGAPVGTVPEAYKKLFEGVATIELTKLVTYDTGFVTFPQINNAKKWNYVKLELELPENTSILSVPIGNKITGEVDTLFNLQTTSDSISLVGINTDEYPSIAILSQLVANSLKESPKIKSLSAYFEGLPELAVNYQVVSTDKDTIMQGERINFYAKIYNAGKSSVDSFKIILELLKPDNNFYVLMDTIIGSLSQQTYVPIEYSYTNKIYDGYGEFSFRLKIDDGDRNREYYETNNIYLQNFYVKKDTTTSVSAAQVYLTINGKEIKDWEYVEPEGKIELKIDYPVWFPVQDTSAVQIFLDGRRIFNESLVFDYDTIDRRINIQYQTKFEKGEHNLRIYLKDAFGRIPSQPIIEKYFVVTSNLEILRVYNYPNPFSNGTYFTFVLTQVPDEVQIKIYTIAGRLIKEIKLSQIELSTNFNKIYWDGKDEDGDIIGNGVYLYKLIAKKGDQVQTTIQKLAVVR
ncbi:MAG: C25 family cysteine peptidase [Ignavibacteria bacterium]